MSHTSQRHNFQLNQFFFFFLILSLAAFLKVRGRISCSEELINGYTRTPADLEELI